MKQARFSSSTSHRREITVYFQKIDLRSRCAKLAATGDVKKDQTAYFIFRIVWVNKLT